MKRFALLISLVFITSCDVFPTGNTIYSPKSNSGNSSNETKEFAALIEKDQLYKKEVNAKVLTYLLSDTDSKDKNTAIIIENASRCDIILRVVNITNGKIYNLPISRNSENQFVIQKGNYTLKSNICQAKYYSQKNIVEPLILKLSQQ